MKMFSKLNRVIMLWHLVITMSCCLVFFYGRSFSINSLIWFPLELLYMCQCGFYIYSISVLLTLGAPRKDFAVMMSHHVLILVLLGYSYSKSYHIHEVSKLSEVQVMTLYVIVLMLLAFHVYWWVRTYPMMKRELAGEDIQSTSFPLLEGHATDKELPDDILFEILLWLPVKTLTRFKCVSKRWRQMIENPGFIKNQHASLKGKEYVLVKSFCKETGGNVLNFVSDETTVGPIKIPFFERTFLELLGPYNGIICLTDWNTIVLCNPSIEEFKLIPTPDFIFPADLKYEGLSVGFGIDSNGEVKVVRIIQIYSIEASLHHSKAEIYSMKTDSWRELEDGLPYISQIAFFARLVEGAFHWFAIHDDLSESILCFNMTTEVFQNIPLPDDIGSSLDGEDRGLSVLGESLALILYDPLLDEKCFHIWVMHDYGVKESWTKQFTIGPLSLNSPLLFWEDKELLLQGSDGQLVSCNLHTQKIKEFQLLGVPGTMRAVIYRESLVSLKRGSEVGK